MNDLVNQKKKPWNFAKQILSGFGMNQVPKKNIHTISLSLPFTHLGLEEAEQNSDEMRFDRKSLISTYSNFLFLSLTELKVIFSKTVDARFQNGEHKMLSFG